MYKLLVKPIFFLFAPEKIHHLVFTTLKLGFKVPGIAWVCKKVFCLERPSLARKVFGVHFANPVGLAAGFDKDAKLYDELAAFGFGFVEIGTLTPLGQPGNEKPRMFRLIEDDGLINRMGFNNEGVEAAVKRLKKRKGNVVIGGNIGKNKTTPNQEATEDYKKCFHALFDYVDYFVVNVSSPNTPNLRALQDKEPLKELLSILMQLNKEHSKAKPLLLKIAPDLSNEQLDDIVEITKETGINGLVATNTTISREGLNTAPEKLNVIGAGGLSGKPLTKRATEVIRYLSDKLEGKVPIIGVGGIHSAEDALEKLRAGASLVQVYTGFIYEGPGLIRSINKAIVKEGL